MKGTTMNTTSTIHAERLERFRQYVQAEQSAFARWTATGGAIDAYNEWNKARACKMTYATAMLELLLEEMDREAASMHQETEDPRRYF